MNIKLNARLRAYTKAKEFNEVINHIKDLETDVEQAITSATEATEEASGSVIDDIEKTQDYELIIRQANGTETNVGNIRGATGVSIVSVEKTSTKGLIDTYTITFSNGNTSTFTVTNGEDGVGIVSITFDPETYELTIILSDGQSVTTTSLRGEQGVGIVSITKTSTVGYVDTYTILLSDGTTYTFDVTNGVVVDDELSTTSTNPVQNKVITELITKVVTWKPVPYVLYGSLSNYTKTEVVAKGSTGSAITIDNPDNDQYNCVAFSVVGGEKIKVTTTITGKNNYPVSAILFVDENNVIISQEYTSPNSTTRYTLTDQEFIVPENSVYVWVNRRYSVPGYPIVKKLVSSNTYPNELSELTIVEFNCGMFNHTEGSSSTTDLEYKQNWRNLLNSTKGSLFALSDYTDSFGVGELDEETSKDILFGNTTSYFLKSKNYNPPSNQGGLRLGSRSISIRFVEDFNLGGASYGVWRQHAEKYLVEAFDKQIMLYLGHYQPSAGYEAARAVQYNRVIQDASHYEYVIICGDFNAQSFSEYQPFVNAGYVLGNGGYTGEHMTLRNIPADNIIYSRNFLEDNFKLLSGYTLNTDHTPISLTLKLR